MALLFAGARAVIDFLEELEVLTNLRVVGLELERLLVGLARLVELAFVLVGDREVVERGGVGRIDLDRSFPAVDGFAPEAALRDADAERDLLLRVAPRVGERRSSRQESNRRTGCDAKGHDGITPTIATGLAAHARQLAVHLRELAEQAMCHG